MPTGGTFDLTELTSYGFKLNNVIDGTWTNGKVEGTTLTVNPGATEVTYDYNCGKGYTIRFTLLVNDSSTGVPIDSAHFPDEAFRTYLSGIGTDRNQDGHLSAGEISRIWTIDVSNTSSLTDLTGIEYFTSLGTLKCTSCTLTALDVSKNTALTLLWCNDNQLKALDVSSNTKLEKLLCARNQLTSLDLSKNKDISDLYFYAADNIYPITLTNRTFDLTKLEQFGFKLGNVIDETWTNGTVEGTTLTVEPGVNYVTYDYNCGNGKTVTFKLLVANKYTISFNANGGSGSMTAETVVPGSYTLPECGFDAPQGLQFAGWATSKSGEVISDTTIAVTEDTTLYAIWGINYGVTVNGVKVTSLNKDNVLGNDNVKYDPATRTLSVKDFVAGDLTVAGDGETIVNISDKLGAPAVGTLTVIDAKDVTVTANSGAPAIFGKADITCTGNITITNSKGMAVSAPLTVTNAQNVTVEGYGDQAIVGITDITCTGNVTITNSKGMAVSNPLTVNSAKDVTVTGNSSSAPAIAGTADITCTGKVMITNSTGIAVKSALTVKNAKDVTVTANSSSYPAIRGTADITCSGDVEITNSTGMAVNSGLTVKSAKDVTVTANTADSSYPAIGGTTDITCSGDVIISNSNGRAVGSGLKYQRGSDHGYTVKTGLSLDELTDYAVKEAGQDFTIDSLEASAVKISVGHTSDEWQNSSTQHWQVCTVCGDEFNRTDHTFSGRTCTVCGYTKPSSGSSSSGSTTVTPTEPEITTGGGTTVAEIETKVTTSGTTSKAAVSQDTLEKAIEAAGSAAEKAGTDTAVEIVVNTPAEATEVKVDLSAEGLGSFAASEAQSLTISTGVGTVTISPEAAASIAEQTGDDNVTVTISEVTRPENTLNEHQLAAVGDAQVYNLSVTGNGKYITDFDGGLITVSLPYMLKAGEKPNGVVVYYVDDQGSIKRVRAMYDVKTQSIIFTTNHFSFYMVRYESDAAAAARFTDVPEGSYYEDAVIWAVGRGITTGTTETTFSPDASCTRAQMVTFLWRAAGSPKADGSSPFTDVSPDAYYYDAVLWAVENGITSGTSATTFAPDATVTRDQTVTFMWRAAGSPAANGSGFSDVSGDAYYADAVAWAVENGITTGTGSGLFSPDDDCTRAQIVTFLYRYMGE